MKIGLQLHVKRRFCRQLVFAGQSPLDGLEYRWVLTHSRLRFPYITPCIELSPDASISLRIILLATLILTAAVLS